MSKKILGIGLVIAGIALQAIPGIGQAIGLPMIAAGISSAAVIGVTLAIAGSFLMGPGKPKGLTGGASPTDRLQSSLIPTDQRQSWLGKSNPKPQVRYQAFTGTKQEYLEQIICCASHKVHSIDELWLDSEKAWSASGGVASKFASFLTVATVLEGTSSNGIAIDSNWTVHSTLTGCAYIHLKFLLVHKASDGSNDSPFASGVTSRMTIRGKGALTYDPRLDSTVAGGSGTQRAADQTTWAWDDNGSRNPALQALWYELGWKINGKLAVGKGLPPARIDLASYAVAANICDETITKSAANGGGTEPRYRSDGVVSEADDPGAVRDHLCVTMNALLRDAGGRLSLNVIHNDLATPVTPSGRSAFDENDVLGEMQWDQTPDLSNTFNIVRGTFIDASDNALYQPVDFPEVSLASPDGIDRIDTVAYPMVESNGQAQRLAKQRLERNQYQGQLSFTGGAAFWGLTLGDVFPLTHAAFGWSGKLFRCAGHKMSRTGSVEIVAVEENAAIYAWDNNEAAAVQPGTPTIYDALNDPVLVSIVDAGTTASWPNVTNPTGTKPADNATVGAISGPGGNVTGAVDANGYPLIDLSDTGHLNKNVDNVADGATYGRPIITRLSGGKPLIDFAEPIHLNKGALATANTISGDAQLSGNIAARLTPHPLDNNYIATSRFLYDDGSLVSSLKPAELGAEKTTGKSVDILVNGATYGRPLLSRLNAGRPTVDLSEGIHSNVNTQYITDGAKLGVTAAIITGPASSTVSADSTGTIKSGQLPKDIQFHATTGLADLTTAGAWSFTAAPSGGVTATIGAATGDLNLTALNTSPVTLTISFTYFGVARTFTHTITKVSDPPSNSGGTGSTGGTTATTTTLGSTTSTAYDTTNAVSATLTAKAGSGGQVQCSAPVSFLRSVNTAGTQDAWGKWQWRVVGGTFADITTEVKSTLAADNENVPPMTKYDGYLPVTMTKTGLTNGTSYEFRFLWRNDSGASALNYDGGALTATGS